MFKVVPDQLKISDGWVRCGHCSDVFDATLYLEKWTSPEMQGGAGQPDAQPPTAPAGPQPFLDTAPDMAPAPSEATRVLPSGERVDTAVDLSRREPQTPDPFSGPGDGAPWANSGMPDAALEANTAAEAESIAEQFANAPVHLNPPDASPVEELPRRVDVDAWHAEVPPADPVHSDMTEDGSATGPAMSDWGELLAATPGTDDQSNARVEAEVGLAVNERRGTHQASDDLEFHAELKRYAAVTQRGADADKEHVEAKEEGNKEAIESAEEAANFSPQAAPDEDSNPPAPEIDAPDAGEETSVAELGFVQQARRRAFWQSPLMRLALSLLALVLLALLTGQWALHERDKLAARFPEAMPTLTRVCESLGCEVGAVHNIEAIAIDSSTLVRKLGNFYSFDLVLKNQAPLALAVPAIELSLTDTRDAVISRRVFLPEELPDVPPLLPSSGTIAVSLRLSLTVDEAQPMAGYRVLIFYP